MKSLTSALRTQNSVSRPCRLPARTPVPQAGGAGSTPARATRFSAVAKQQTQRSHTPPIEGASPSSATICLLGVASSTLRSYRRSAGADPAAGPTGWSSNRKTRPSQRRDPGAIPGRSTTWPRRLAERIPVLQTGNAGSTPAEATSAALAQTDRVPRFERGGWGIIPSGRRQHTGIV